MRVTLDVTNFDGSVQMPIYLSVLPYHSIYPGTVTASIHSNTVELCALFILSVPMNALCSFY